MPATTFIERFRTVAARAAHPHLAPINRATFQSDHGLALAKANSLLGYQKFLAAARTAKAQRNGATMAFEHNVQGQARQALDDAQALSGAVLRMTQQANHTDLWSQMHTRLIAALGASGPVSAKQIWSEIQQGLQNPQYKAALQNAGLSDGVASAMSDAVSKIDANLVLRNGQVAVETQVAGESQPRRVKLKAPHGQPRGIVDLLQRSQFDKVVSAFSNNDPVYIEAVPLAGEAAYEPADLFAIGAVAVRQGVADHVRKLEDTGLATYQGNDPGTVILTAFVIALVAGALGAGILYLCDDPPDNVQQPDFVCDIGFALIYLAAIFLGAIAVVGGGGVLAFCAMVAFMLLWTDVVLHFPTFTPATASAP
jgi:hypothetical protein